MCNSMMAVRICYYRIFANLAIICMKPLGLKLGFEEGGIVTSNTRNLLENDYC